MRAPVDKLMERSQRPGRPGFDFDGNCVFPVLDYKIDFRGRLSLLPNPENRLVRSGSPGGQHFLADDHLGDFSPLEGMEVGVLEVLTLKPGGIVDEPNI
jgi:hypothetical protein